MMYQAYFNPGIKQNKVISYDIIYIIPINISLGNLYTLYFYIPFGF